jgi:hypothetical protein
MLVGGVTKCGGLDVYSMKYGTRLNTQNEVHILADLPDIDSQISPEMLTHFRPPQYLFKVHKYSCGTLFSPVEAEHVVTVGSRLCTAPW